MMLFQSQFCSHQNDCGPDTCLESESKKDQWPGQPERITEWDHGVLVTVGKYSKLEWESKERRVCLPDCVSLLWGCQSIWSFERQAEPGVVAHDFNSRTLEAQASRSLSYIVREKRKRKKPQSKLGGCIQQQSSKVLRQFEQQYFKNFTLMSTHWLTGHTHVLHQKIRKETASKRG